MYDQRHALPVLIVRAVIPLPGLGTLPSLPCCRSHPTGPTSFRVFPCRPSVTLPAPGPRTLHSTNTPSRPAAPGPAAPTSHLPQLAGPVPHGGLSCFAPAPEPERPLNPKFGTPAPHSHFDTSVAPAARRPQAPLQSLEALSLAPSTVNGKEAAVGPPHLKLPQVGIPFSFPPSRSRSLSHAPSGMTLSMRTGWQRFRAPGSGAGRKLSRPERKSSCRDVRSRCHPRGPNWLVLPRKRSCQKRGWGASWLRHLSGPTPHITPCCPCRHVASPAQHDGPRNVTFCQSRAPAPSAGSWGQLSPPRCRCPRTPAKPPRGGEGALTAAREPLSGW